MSDTIYVLVVEDNLLTTQLLDSMFRRHEHIRARFCSGTTGPTLEAARQQQPSVIVLDSASQAASPEPSWRPCSRKPYRRRHAS